MTNKERIARYEESKAQGAVVEQREEVWQRQSGVWVRQSKKKKRNKGKPMMTLPEAQEDMRADIAAGIPVNGWPV